MKIAIFGMGYVGFTLATCLASRGHEISGVDVDKAKVEKIREGISPIDNGELRDIFRETRASIKMLRPEEALDASEICFICVNTPEGREGKVNTNYVREVVKTIAAHLKRRNRYLLIALKSTVPPGTSKSMIFLLEMITGKKCGRDFGFCVNPEFLREASPVSDFFNPPFVVIGADDFETWTKLGRVYERLGMWAPRFSIVEAELFKYINNTFHAMKVAFANEVKRICDSFHADSELTMRTFCSDHRLNISPYYLKPGKPFGGSCLPKDVAGLKQLAKDIETPLLDSILKSNEVHKRHESKRKNCDIPP